MRSSGILLPISSLASDFGIGTFGEEAYAFVDFLYDSKQKYWQILPLGHTGFGDSPYQCFSAFAGNPYFIDPDLLLKDGYLLQKDIIKSANENIIDYGYLYNKRLPLVKKAASAVDLSDENFLIFDRQNQYWLDDYALFMAVKENNKMKPLKNWEKNIKIPDFNMIDNLKEKYKSEIKIWKAVQFLFYSQWSNLKKYANARGIKIIGDVPIYLSADSAEMWLNSELFITDENGDPSFVAGCPPDEFSPMGQLWGNPLFDWDYHIRNDFEWWINRLKFSSKNFDVIRIDHFRGFEDYYAVDSKLSNAVIGEWRKGPSKLFIDSIKKNLPDIKIIAEDLGNITDGVKELLNYSGFPGMKILQFAFDRSDNEFLPHNYNKNCVSYTGTHDNPTMKQWTLISDDESFSFAKKYLNVNNNDSFVNDCIRALYSSVSDTVIIPVQDWLELGAQSRLNVPSISSGNWIWRLKKGDITPNLTKRIKEMTELYFRDNQEETI